MKVLIQRKGVEWNVLTDNGGGGAWGIGTTFLTPVAAQAVAGAIADAKRGEGETVQVVLCAEGQLRGEVVPV